MRKRNLLLSRSREWLSKREIEILALMSDGLSNQNLAEKIFLSLATVKWYNQQIFQKLGVSNRTQAIVKAREMGLFKTGVVVSTGEGSRPRHNLPARLSSYIGREQERTDLLALLQDPSNRLVSIVGPGGIGKTALALRAAEESIPGFLHGVWLIDLAPVTDTSQVAQVIANTLGIREEPGVSIEDLLMRYLHLRILLLILDNCEHLVEACARITVSVLKSCPSLHILATSREALGVSGELRYPLGALPFPDPDRVASLEQLRQYESVQLFRQRAVLVSSSFEITEDNAPAVRQLCQRLEGIPLALELAAARVNVFSVADIVEHMDVLLWKFKTNPRASLPRHHSLQACLDWSYSLLSTPERILLRRLSVFVGGWTLEAAMLVCADRPDEGLPGDQLASTSILDCLSNLVNKSLVVSLPADPMKPGQEICYRLLDTIHKFGRDRLGEASELQTLRDRHLDYFLHFIEQAAPKLRCAEQLVILRKIDSEWDNLLAAMRWALAEESPKKEISPDRTEKGLRLGNALLYYWELSGQFLGIAKYLKQGLEWINLQNERWQALYARTLFTIGFLLMFEEMGRTPRQCVSVLEESIRLLKACEDWPCLARAQAYLAWITSSSPEALVLVDESIAICRQVGDLWNLADVLWCKISIAEGVTALAAGQESLTLFRQIEDPWRIHWSLAAFGGSLVRQGHYGEGNACLEECARFFEERGSLKGLTFLNHSRGEAAYYLGDFNQMAVCFRRGLEVYHQRGMIGLSVHYLREIGTACKRLGDFTQSTAYYLESYSKAKALGETGCMCVALSGIAGVAAAVHQPVRAVHLLGTVETMLEALNETMDPISQKESVRDMALIREQLDEEAIQRAWMEGREMSLEEAFKEAFDIKIT